MFSSIVVGSNGKQGGQDAAALAKLLAGGDSRLVFAHVRVSDLAPARGSNLDFDFAQSVLASKWVEHDRGLWEGAADARMTAAPSVGQGLEQVAADREADLIVVGACEHGALGRVMIGDDAASVLHQADRAVAIAPRGYASRGHMITRIGVAFDGSAESELARALASDLAEELHARLLTRCIVTPHVFVTGIGSAASYMEDPEDLRARTRAALGKFADRTEILIGSVEPMLQEFSHEVDLLVCGNRHNNLMRRVALGTTSGYLAHHAACPLLVGGSPVAVGASADRVGEAADPRPA